MIRTSVLALATVTVVASAAIVGTAAWDPSRTDGTSCTCSTIDLASGPVTLVVLADGTEGASTSVSQQVSQVNDRARVRIDVDHGGTSVEIAGETVSNGSLVLNVTRDGEVVNESVVADPDEIGTMTFRLGSDGVDIHTDEERPSECSCDDVDVADVRTDEDGDDSDVAEDAKDLAEDAKQCSSGDSNVDVNVGGEGEVNVGNVAEDTNVSAGNVEVNVPVLGSGDSEANASQHVNDSGDDFQSQQNADGDTAGTTECEESSLGDGHRSGDVSPADRSTVAGRTGGNVFRVVVQPHDLAGLVRSDESRGISIGGLLSELRSGAEDGSD